MSSRRIYIFKIAVAKPRPRANKSRSPFTSRGPCSHVSMFESLIWKDIYYFIAFYYITFISAVIIWKKVFNT